jgi:hypothetical protein
MDGENPTVPDHLRPLLGAAAELELEHATDGYWSTDGDERAVARARLLQVARTAENWGAGTCSREEIAKLADGAGPEAADALDVLADVGLARLGFGNGTTDVASSGAMLTTIRAPGLTLPEPGVARETYSRAERISVATLSLVASLAVRLVCDDRAQHKVVILDECWFLLAASQGRALVNRLVRLARSFNATVVLSTQLVGDLSGVRDLVRTWFIFGQDSDAEAAQALRLIGIEPTTSATARLRQAEAGRCIMRDLHGRVAEVQLDVADPRLLAAFNTAPPTQRLGA